RLADPPGRLSRCRAGARRVGGLQGRQRAQRLPAVDGAHVPELAGAVEMMNRLCFSCTLLLMLAALPAFAMDDMAGMDHAHMHMDHGAPADHPMTMTGFYGAYPMNREASGTSWVPES